MMIETGLKKKKVDSKMDISKVIENSVKVSAPSWPLQNTVAVNPFWFLRSEAFESVIEDVSRLLDSEVLMPVQYYQQLYSEGKITREALEMAILEARTIWPGIESQPERFLEHGAIESLDRVRTLSEFMDGFLDQSIIAEVGKYCAAYLDRNQAIAPFPRG